MRHDQFEDFLGALIAEIDAAHHQERGDQPGRDQRQDQRARQQEEQLVLQRAERDLPDDRQFTRGGEAHRIARRHRRVVDDDAGRLGAGLGRLCDDVVDGGCRDLGDPGDVVEQREQSRSHVSSPW
jgi:hypothetical protein